jgi:prepilin-type processing-associated H-X9-DG protein
MGSATKAWAENRNYIRPIKDWNRSSYTYNINLCPGNPYNRASYSSQKDIVKTSETPILGDGWWRAPSWMNNNRTRYIPQNLDDPFNGNKGSNTADRFITNRHGNMTILSYVDGHSESVYLEDVFKQYWYQGYDINQPVLRF